MGITSRQNGMQEKANEHGNDGTQQRTNTAFTRAHHRDLCEGSEVRIPQVSAASGLHVVCPEFPDHVLHLVWAGPEFECRDRSNSCPDVLDRHIRNLRSDGRVAVWNCGWPRVRSGARMATGEACQSDAA